MPPRRTAPGSARSSDVGTRRMSATAASEADTGASMAEGLIGAMRAAAARGRSGCHRPGKVTSAAGRIRVKAVRVHDRRDERRPQVVIRSIWPLWCHTSPGPVRCCGCIACTTCHRGVCRHRGSSTARPWGSDPLPSRGFRQWLAGHPATGHLGCPPRTRVGAAIRGPTACTSASARGRSKPAPWSFSRRADGFRALVTLTTGSGEPAQSSAT